jgi:cellulose synthase/poly-beta-1,6-N-acetylglucosamine synthase-like glycosyltransferase
VSQPHRGKRDIMYTAMNMHTEDIELVALTDSDTLWEKDTLENLVKVIVGHDRYREENTTCSCIKIK